MALFSTDRISSVLACTASISRRADCSISSDRSRISIEYPVRAAQASAICTASSWVPEALAVMAAVFLEISSRAAESCSVRPESFRALPLEVRVRPRISPTTPPSRSELSCKIPMASRIGAMTYFRIIRRAAHTSSTPTARAAALVIRETV